MKIKIINTLFWVAVGFIICLLIFWRPWETGINVTVTKPVDDIKKEVAEVVVPSEKKTDSFTTMIAVLKKETNTLEKNLWAAWRENERLNKKYLAIKEKPTVIVSNGTADDFTEVLTATANSDSLCEQAINNLNSQIDLKDSIIFQNSLANIALKKGFDDMVTNSMQKDAIMKQLNNKMKWQKLQAVGFKATAAAILFFVIKNNLK